MKNVNLLEEIKSKKCGSYRVRLEDKEKLKKQLKELRENNIFSKHKMTYVYTETKNDIVLILHNTLGA